MTVAYLHVERAEKYVSDVLDGTIPACRWLRLACQRHVQDKKKALLRSWPYYFDREEAERPCAFGEMLPHVKGQWAKRHELIHLEGWECFILVSLFGWRRKKNGRRRFREALLLIPRKNGKSMLAAIIGDYMWCMDGEVGAEVYSGATTEKQAWEVFKPARLMVEQSPDLISELGGNCVNAKSLVIEEDQSKFEPMIGKPGDGASPSCAIIDEYHEHDTSDMVDTMKTGMLAREQPLLLKISTAGNNLAGPCYDAVLDAQKVLEGIFENEELFTIIYTIDETDDWADPKNLLKANPNFGISVDVDMLLADQRQAVLNPADQNRFKTKHLNIWCAAKTVWMPLDVWDLCGDKDLSPDEFMGEPAWFILDLASKDDIAAYIKLFRKRVGEFFHFYSFERYYIPEGLLEVPGPNQTAYRKWAAQKFLTTTDGEEIDFDRIAEDVLDDKNKFQLLEMVYDPWRATQLAHQMEKAGATTVELRQTVQNISAPMKEVLSAVKGGRYHHAANPVTRWMMSNVTAKLDAKDNIYPRKEKPHMKIDGAVGVIMGMSRAMLPPDAGIEQWLKNGPVIA